MSGVEGIRVMSVLDEMLEGLTIFSYLTPELLKSADQLGEVLGQGIAESIAKHKHALASAKGHVANDELIHSVLDVWRKFKKSPTAEAKLMALHVEPTDAALQVIELFKQLRDFAYKKLTTTVEEDNSQREHFEEVKIREEKAMSEKQQLQQKLKLERIERQKQMNTIKEEEDRANVLLNTMRTNHGANMQAAMLSSSSDRAAKKAETSAEQLQLEADLEAANKQLAQLREENKEREMLMRKAKKKAEQDAELAIAEYDKELSEREKDYQEELAMFTALEEKLAEYKTNIQDMKSEREQHEDEIRRVALAIRKKSLENIRRRRAVRIIQESWLDLLAARKKAKKAKGNAKGKKK